MLPPGKTCAEAKDDEVFTLRSSRIWFCGDINKTLEAQSVYRKVEYVQTFEVVEAEGEYRQGRTGSMISKPFLERSDNNNINHGINKTCNGI
jgi:hypothetical protein